MAVACLLMMASVNGYSQFNVLSRQQQLNSLPGASIDLHRVQNGYFSHLGNPAGGIGTFGGADKWMLFGAPVNPGAFYGTQMQWNGQGYNTLLRDRGNGIKDALVEWGGQANSEFQVRFLPNSANPAVFNRQFTMLTNGNAYFGATPVGNNAKVEINTTNQIALATRTTNTASGYFLSSAVVAGNSNMGSYAIARSLALNTWSYGAIGIAQSNQNQNLGSRNFGVYGAVSAQNNQINYGVYGNAPTSPANGWGNVNGSYAGFFQGDVYCTGMYIGSDGKYKVDVQPETGVLAKVMAVEPVTYFMDTAAYPLHNFSKKLQHGFIADNLARVFPEVVQTANFVLQDADLKDIGEDQGNVVNYGGLISVLFAAIQEQQAQINELKAALGTARTTGAARETNMVSENAPLTNNLLAQNSPNPFTENTTIRYNLPVGESNGSIAVYDLNGNIMMSFNNLQGNGQVTIQGRRLQPGTYVYKLMLNNKEQVTRKMVLTR